MAKTYNTNYLKFDAFSMKELIKRKLSEDTSFTDHVYEGSNLSILIDIFSNMFQVLMYNLNNAAAESMFTDTQLYENMNRIVKFIGYNPRGFSPASVTVNLTNVDSAINGQILPPYTYVKLNEKDVNGNDVYYSTDDYYYVYDDDNLTTDTTNQITMYNGRWTLYSNVLIAQGLPYEKFILQNLRSDSSDNEFVAWPFVHVYVKRETSSGTYEWIKFLPTDSTLFLKNDSLTMYGPDDAYFELRLNEFKQYEITFGNGIHGRTLKLSDELYIVYLNANGESGEIAVGDINQSINGYGIHGLDHRIFMDSIYGDVSDTFIALENLQTTYPITAINQAGSSSSVIEESTDEIRQNAPEWFKSAGRLITQRDFESFIKSRFYNDVLDVVAMNNWQYIASFYRWLYNIGLTVYSDGSHYITTDLETKYDYVYADAADSNNVYLWVRTKNDAPIIKAEIENQMLPMKSLTTEPVFLTPITVEFLPAASVVSGYDDLDNPDSSILNYIEVEAQSSALVSSEIVKSTVQSYIIDFFDTQSQKLGADINFNTLYDELISIKGVKRIRTIYKNGNNVTTINGLSFAKWSSDIIDGDDLTIATGSVKLEQFQRCKIFARSLLNRIKIVTSSVYQSNNLEY
jgi:hypothetical protein